MDQSCPVVHKIRRPQARLQTAKLFCNNCVKGEQEILAEYRIIWSTSYAILHYYYYEDLALSKHC
jgi:hypothetical protein